MISRQELSDYLEIELNHLYSCSELEYFNRFLIEDLGLENCSNPMEERAFLDALDKLKKNIPYQQIVGFTIFYNLRIRIDSNVLIPRPETEELIEWILEYESTNESLEVVDLCSGSGVIALAIKSEKPTFKVIGYELSQKALELSIRNKEHLNLDVNFESQDVLDPVFNISSADIIISNPPYIALSEKVNMDRRVLEHEPEMALFISDEDPLIFYRRIADLLKGTKEGSRAYFEINQELAKETIDIFEEMNFQCELKKDLSSNWRFLKAINKKVPPKRD